MMPNGCVEVSIIIINIIIIIIIITRQCIFINWWLLTILFRRLLPVTGATTAPIVIVCLGLSQSRQSPGDEGIHW